MKNRYSNLHILDIRRGITDFARWFLGGYKEGFPAIKPPEDFKYPLPGVEVELGKPKVMWVNHCTFLVDIEGVRFLTDPIWSNRASPLPFFGPRRQHAPPVAIKDLPKIDAILISHNHYDHLDAKSVRELNRRFPGAKWYVPKGLGSWFIKRGITEIKELAWWEESCVTFNNKEFTVSSVPSQHHSGRGLFDGNRTLWMGIVVRGGNKSFYFTGDTAYNSVDFKRIGDVHAKIDLCLCPIGTYLPERFMRTVHSSPQDAVCIHQDVKAALSVGMHWKTFKLSEEHVDAPPYHLYLEMKKRNINPLNFLAIDPGKWINF